MKVFRLGVLTLALSGAGAAQADGALYACVRPDGSSAIVDAPQADGRCEALQAPAAEAANADPGDGVPADAGAAGRTASRRRWGAARPTPPMLTQASPAAADGSGTATGGEAEMPLSERLANYRDMMRSDLDIAGNLLPAGPLSAQGRRYKMIDKATYQSQLNGSAR
jgi:hypothetical protein